MNRVISRSKVLLLLIILLCLGLSLFLVEYAINGNQWVYSHGSPHIYNKENIACGQNNDFMLF